eukprot:XP_001697776.1 predicted protein [Chlamydomonas reinhardtii]
MDAFALLTGGAHFDRRRYRKDIDAFNPKAVSSAAIQEEAMASARRQGAAGSEVGSKRRQAKANAKKRRRLNAAAAKAAAGVSEEEDEPDIALFAREGDSAAGERDGGSELGPLVDDVIPVVHTNDPHEEANLIRKALRIKATGTDVPAPLKSFAELASRYKVGRRLLAALRAAGFTAPTPIQRQAIPALLEGRELLAVAPTGSGKTLAFLVPLLARLKSLRAAAQASGQAEQWPNAVKALVVSPTHELAAQQARVLKLLLPGSGLRACLLCKATAAGTDFSKVDALLAAAQHPDVSRALFSATLPERVEDLARSVQQQPLRITVGMKNAATSSVNQKLHFVGREAGKLLALRQALADGGLKPPVLVFVGSKERAKALHRELLYDGVHVDSITAGQPQAARNAAIDNFRAGKTWVLIATDLIGRGMDFVGINTVINYDFPRTTADYVHRIGRTGRAGHTGFCEATAHASGAQSVPVLPPVSGHSRGQAVDAKCATPRSPCEALYRVATAPPHGVPQPYGPPPPYHQLHGPYGGWYARGHAYDMFHVPYPPPPYMQV